jgi:hypothetical protein
MVSAFVDDDEGNRNEFAKIILDVFVICMMPMEFKSNIGLTSFTRHRT